MNKSTLLLLLSLSFSLMAMTIGEGDNVFVVLPKNAFVTVKVAAEELETHLSKRTGATIAITEEQPASGKVIRLALKDGTNLKADGFAIECTGHIVDIYGNDTNDIRANEPFSLYFNEKSKGTLNGAYRFLEKFCGIAWVAPGEIGTCIPEKGTVTILEGKIVDEPALKMRHTVNMYEMRSKFSDRDEYGESFRQDLLRWGVRIGLSGHKWPVQGCHTIERMQLFKTYGKEHPEYFSLQKDGSRGGRFGGLCWSNPDVTKILFRAADAWFSGKSPQEGGLGVDGKYWPYPFYLSKDEFMIDSVDEFAKTQCNCQHCSTSNVLEEVWKRIAEVAQMIKEKYPDKFITTLAYPPKLEPPSFTLPDNVLVRLTLPGSNGLENERTNVFYKQLLEKWHELQKRTIPLWIYYVAKDYGTAGTLETSPALFQKYLRQVRPYTDNIFFESSYIAQTQRNYELWMQSKLLWNPDASLDDLKKEYFERGYGAASVAIQQFYDRLEYLWIRILRETWDSGDEDIPRLFEGNWRANKSNRQIFKTIYTAEEITSLSRMLADASAKVPDNPAISRRISLLDKWIVSIASKEREQIMFADDTKNRTELCVAVIDHAPTQDDWAKAQWNNLSPFAERRNEKLQVPGRFKLIIDPQQTTIHAELTDPLIDNSKTVPNRTEDSYGDIWLDNDLEFFISNKAIHRQLLMNDMGNFIVYDIEAGVRRKHPTEGIIAKASKNASGWAGDITLPHSITGINPAAGGSCRINILRSRNVNGAPTEYSTWSRTIGNDSVIDPDMYGRLVWADVSKMKVTYSDGLEPSTDIKMRTLHSADFSQSPGNAWHIWSHPDMPPNHRWNPDDGHNGNGCLEIEYPGKSSGSWSCRLPIKPGARIRLTAWIRHSNGSAQLSFGCLDKNSRWVEFEKYGRRLQIPSYGNWVRGSFETTVPEDQRISLLTLGFNSIDTPGTMQIDDVIIEVE